MLAMKKLQPIKCSAPRDHAPVLLHLNYHIRFGFSQQDRVNLDRDALMNACTRDLPRRRDFLRALETNIQEAGDNKWNEAIEKATPDKLYDHLQ